MLGHAGSFLRSWRIPLGAGQARSVRVRSGNIHAAESDLRGEQDPEHAPTKISQTCASEPIDLVRRILNTPATNDPPCDWTWPILVSMQALRVLAGTPGYVWRTAT